MISLTITAAGRAALVNAQNNGTLPIVIDKVGVTSTAIVSTAATAALPGEIKRIATISGDVVDPETIHVTVRDESADAYPLRSFALYLADGTLFASYGQAAPIVDKSAQALLLLSIDVKFADVDAAAISFGNADFINPPATTETLGVVELATDAEVETGTDAERAATPKGIKAAVTAWLDTRFGAGAPSALVKTLLTAATAAAFRTSLAIKSAALKDEGAGNGLDADLLDGQHGAYYSNIPARLGYTPWGPTNDGAGSGLDADLLRGASPGAMGLTLLADATAAAGRVTLGIGTMGVQNANAVAITGGAATLQGLTMRSGGSAYLTLVPGSASNTGYVEFRRADDVRLAYMGFAAAGGAIPMVVENGATGWAFTGSGSFSGTLIAAHGQFTGASAPSSGSGVEIQGGASGNISAYNRSSSAYISLSLDASLVNVRPNGSLVASFAATGVSVTGTISSSGRITSGSTLQVTGSSAPPNGAGIELSYNAGSSVGNIGAYSRDAAAYRHLNIDALGIDIRPSGVAVGTFTAAGLAVTGSISASSGLAVAGRATFSAGTYTATPLGTGIQYCDSTNGMVFAAQGGTLDFLFANRNGSTVFSVPTGTRNLAVAGDITRAGFSVWDSGNDGSGSGLDADLLDGQHGSYYLPAASYTAADVLAKINSVDGPGSGLDSDLLDGQHGAYYLNFNNLTGKPASYTPSAHTHGAADIAGAFSSSNSTNGYIVLPNGLIFQWCRGGTHSPGTEGNHFVSFPMTFPNACLFAQASIRLITASNRADADYQIAGEPQTNGCYVQRQRYSSGSDDETTTSPMVFAIGY
ncbi:MAG TPA: hypothetical protein VGD10_08135 [Allosphingosinicella sp.]|uniref:gp53-like domain-containing protein n=1 Tax=Allosphingosinicella sp. TaxID=2823234 RepID=UPI002EDB49CB